MTRRHRSRFASFRPAIEMLEGRCLPSTVMNLMDSGPGSLRQALLDTPAGGTVNFQAGLSGTITLTSTELSIGKNLTIAGPGAPVITVSGNNACEVFSIGWSFTVAISGLTIANGAASSGGGIDNAGALTITGCTLSDNYAGEGGGIFNAGTLTVSNTVVSDNSAGTGGGIYSSGTLTATNSTVSGNNAGEGGGIYSSGTLTVANSTVGGNSAGTGGGIYSSGTLTATNSTVSGNTAGTGGGIFSSTSSASGDPYGRFLPVVPPPYRFPNPAQGFIQSYTGPTPTPFDQNVPADFHPPLLTYGTIKFDYDTYLHSANGIAVDGGGAAIAGGFYKDPGVIVRPTYTLAWVQVVTAVARGADQWGFPPDAPSETFPDASPMNPTYAFQQLLPGVTPPNPPGQPDLAFTDAPEEPFGPVDSFFGAELGLVCIAPAPDMTGFTQVYVIDTFAYGYTDWPAPMGMVTGIPPEGWGPASEGYLTTLNEYYSGTPPEPAIFRSNKYHFQDDQGTCFVASPSPAGTIRNTIIAGNRASSCPDVNGYLPSSGHNLIGDGTGGSGFGASDLVGTAAHPIGPQLSPLQNNGGPTPTIALLPGSPAIGAGDNTGAPVSDERGFTRIVGGTIDIGAFEFQAAGQPTHLGFHAPASTPAGTPFAITVTALDDSGHPATGYTGTVHLVASNGAMASYTFTAADGGQHAFSNLVLRRAGAYTVAGADTDNALITGGTAFTVTPAAADHIAFTVPGTITAGVPFAITVTVQDAYGNTVTGYTGTVHFTLTGPAMAQADYTFTAADMGSHTFNNLVLSQAGDYTLTGMDTGDPTVGGSTLFTVSA
jgi:hypothetical protein